MANSIRVKSASEYIIEVNDKGDTISFDMADTSLTSKVCKMFERVEALSKEYEKKAAEIDQRDDKPHSCFDFVGNDGEIESKTLITQNQYDKVELIDSFYIEARAAVEVLLGVGACQKIFGSKNYFEMFDDLAEQLAPHFEKIGVSYNKLKHSAAQKHAPNRAARRVLK